MNKFKFDWSCFVCGIVFLIAAIVAMINKEMHFVLSIVSTLLVSLFFFAGAFQGGGK